MTMVRIVRTDDRPTAHVDPLSLADACRHAKCGAFGNDGFYRAEFVEPAPLFEAVTYKRASGPSSAAVTYKLASGPSSATPLDDARRVPLAEALTLAAEQRAADENAGIGHRWRTVVRAAR